MSQSEFQQEQLRLLNLIYEELRRISSNSSGVTIPASEQAGDSPEDEEEGPDDELESFE